MMRRRCLTTDETDVHGPWRRFLTTYGRAGATAKVKRATNRRERREGRAEIIEQLGEVDE